VFTTEIYIVKFKWKDGYGRVLVDKNNKCCTLIFRPKTTIKQKHRVCLQNVKLDPVHLLQVWHRHVQYQITKSRVGVSEL